MIFIVVAADALQITVDERARRELAAAQPRGERMYRRKCNVITRFGGRRWNSHVKSLTQVGGAAGPASGHIAHDAYRHVIMRCMHFAWFLRIGACSLLGKRSLNCIDVERKDA
jgi:hypothetical protein